MTNIVKPKQVWELDIVFNNERLHSIVLVLKMRRGRELGNLAYYPGFDLMNGRRIRLFAYVGTFLPDAWQRVV